MIECQKHLFDIPDGVTYLNAAYMGNVGAGIISGQSCVLGQVILRDMGAEIASC